PAYLKDHLHPPAHETDAVTPAFHLLSNLNIPKPPVITQHNQIHYTHYTSLISSHTPNYYFHLYHNPHIHKLTLFHQHLHPPHPKLFPPPPHQPPIPKIPHYQQKNL
ncbi:linear amide C-N hydrolase, partial [Bacillus velezensis]|uniref:linear amide C-N hydrolase n=1 Tax=Bacillus velezensis TaxID=492670 RepID=UPI00119EB776